MTLDHTAETMDRASAVRAAPTGEEDLAPWRRGLAMAWAAAIACAIVSAAHDGLRHQLIGMGRRVLVDLTPWIVTLIEIALRFHGA